MNKLNKNSSVPLYQQLVDEIKSQIDSGKMCIRDRNIGKRYATGNGVDCIVHLARRGVSTAVVSVVGTDEYGGEMFDLCREYQMDTSHLQVKEGKTSVYRMALKDGVDRVHLENIPGVMEHYEPKMCIRDSSCGSGLFPLYDIPPVLAVLQFTENRSICVCLLYTSRCV